MCPRGAKKRKKKMKGRWGKRRATLGENWKVAGPKKKSWGNRQRELKSEKKTGSRTRRPETKGDPVWFLGKLICKPGVTPGKKRVPAGGIQIEKEIGK